MDLGVPVRHGGLMRCCLQTALDNWQERTEEPQEGEGLTCKWCHEPMVWREGAWEWKRDA